MQLSGGLGAVIGRGPCGEDMQAVFKEQRGGQSEMENGLYPPEPCKLR